MRLHPTYKVAVKKSRSLRGGKYMTANIIQTGTTPAPKRSMLRLSDLRSK